MPSFSDNSSPIGTTTPGVPKIYGAASLFSSSVVKWITAAFFYFCVQTKILLLAFAANAYYKETDPTFRVFESNKEYYIFGSSTLRPYHEIDKRNEYGQYQPPESFCGVPVQME
jgi:hypothetical protein